MERLLGWKFWAFTIIGYVFVTLTGGQVFYNWLKFGIGINDLPAFETLAQVLFGAIFFVLFLKPVWRHIWRWPIIGPWLSREVFPDLNGEWDVEMISNWSRIEVMKGAAKDTTLPRYDAETGYPTVGLMKVKTFEKAVIDQGWGSVRMTLHPSADRPHDSHAKAEESITIAFDLLRDGTGRPQVAYLYVQKNKMIDLAATDVPDFLGAAMLTVIQDDTDQLKLKGTYFTARSWVKGLNTAGELTLTKRSEKSIKNAFTHEEGQS